MTIVYPVMVLRLFPADFIRRRLQAAVDILTHANFISALITLLAYIIIQKCWLHGIQ